MNQELLFIHYLYFLTADQSLFAILKISCSSLKNYIIKHTRSDMHSRVVCLLQHTNHEPSVTLYCNCSLSIIVYLLYTSFYKYGLPCKLQHEQSKRPLYIMYNLNQGQLVAIRDTRSLGSDQTSEVGAHCNVRTHHQSFQGPSCPLCLCRCSAALCG